MRSSACSSPVISISGSPGDGSRSRGPRSMPATQSRRVLLRRRWLRCSRWGREVFGSEGGDLLERLGAEGEDTAEKEAFDVELVHAGSEWRVGPLRLAIVVGALEDLGCVGVIGDDSVESGVPGATPVSGISLARQEARAGDALEDVAPLRGVRMFAKSSAGMTAALRRELLHGREAGRRAYAVPEFHECSRCDCFLQCSS